MDTVSLYKGMRQLDRANRAWKPVEEPKEGKTPEQKGRT